jgi:hypothetical protein
MPTYTSRPGNSRLLIGSHLCSTVRAAIFELSFMRKHLPVWTRLCPNLLASFLEDWSSVWASSLDSTRPVCHSPSSNRRQTMGPSSLQRPMYVTAEQFLAMFQSRLGQLRGTAAAFAQRLLCLAGVLLVSRGRVLHACMAFHASDAPSESRPHSRRTTMTHIKHRSGRR